jgi:hypothetical protein
LKESSSVKLQIAASVKLKEGIGLWIDCWHVVMVHEAKPKENPT